MTPHDALELRVTALEKEIPTIKAELKRNTDLTLSIKEDTAGLVEFANASSGLITAAKWLGKLIQWIAPIALVLISVWVAFKDKKM